MVRLPNQYINSRATQGRSVMICVDRRTGDGSSEHKRTKHHGLKEDKVREDFCTALFCPPHHSGNNTAFPWLLWGRKTSAGQYQDGFQVPLECKIEWRNTGWLLHSLLPLLLSPAQWPAAVEGVRSWSSTITRVQMDTVTPDAPHSETHLPYFPLIQIH